MGCLSVSKDQLPYVAVPGLAIDDSLQLDITANLIGASL